MVFAVRVTRKLRLDGMGKPPALHKKCVFSYNSILTLLPMIMDHGYPADTPQKNSDQLSFCLPNFQPVC